MLTNKEKIEIIRKLAKDHDISAYQIGENTTVSNKTAYNILNDDNISPRNKTLNIILEYIETSIGVTKGNYQLPEQFTVEKLKENPLIYKKDFKNLKIDDKLNLIYTHLLDNTESLQLIQDFLLENDLKEEIKKATLK